MTKKVTTPVKGRSVPILSVPTRTYLGTQKVVPIATVPALSELVGTKGNYPTEYFTSERKIYARENPDGSYETLIDSKLIEPDLSRISTTKVELYVVDPSEDLEFIRPFLTRVAAARQSISPFQFVAGLLSGELDIVTYAYRSHKRTLRKHSHAAAVLVVGQLARASFHSMVERLSPADKKPEKTKKQKPKPQLSSKSAKGPKNRTRDSSITPSTNPEQEQLFDA